MKLPILRNVPYLSPSSISEFENCPFKFYLKRMSDKPWPEFRQSMPAAVGSAFDAFVKNGCAARLGLGTDERFSLKTLLSSSVEEHNRDTAVPFGKLLYSQYLKQGMMDRLFSAGMATVEVNPEAVLVDSENSIPIKGYPDAIMADGTIVDWKVQGATSKSGASPTQGYTYGRRGPSVLAPHKKAGQPLELLNSGWARQLTIYSWMASGLCMDRPIHVRIENVAVRPTGPTFTTIETTVSVGFQEELWKDINRIWQAVIEGEIPPAQPNRTRCWAYGQECEMAQYCEAYQNQGRVDDILQELMDEDEDGSTEAISR